MVYPSWVGKVDFLVLGTREKSGKEKRSQVNGSGTRDGLDRGYLDLRLEPQAKNNLFFSGKIKIITCPLFLDSRTISSKN